MEENTQEIQFEVRGDGQMALFSLEELTKTNQKTIEQLNEELKKIREIFDDAFHNDPLYREQDDKTKASLKSRKEVRIRILQQPSIKEMAEKIEHLRAELKERKYAISDYALEYNRLSELTQIEIDGEIYQIVKSAKLVRAK